MSGIGNDAHTVAAGAPTGLARSAIGLHRHLGPHRVAALATRLANVADASHVVDTDTTKEIGMTTKPETAAQALARNLKTARELANRIADHLTELELGNERPAGLHWGHVGDMTETVAGLRAVSDRMFGEGEHAPENR